MLTSIKSHADKMILNDQLLIILDTQNRIRRCEEAEILHWLTMNEGMNWTMRYSLNMHLMFK